MRSELAWTDWSLPIDALEWLNTDSEWRDESRWAIARAFASYPLRPPAAVASLLDRPEPILEHWDALATRRRVIGLAGVDAHGGIGSRIEDSSRRSSLGVPSYAASFRTFTSRVELERAFSGSAARDGAALQAALRAGRMYSQVDAVAGDAVLQFSARTANEVVAQGGELRGTGTASFSVRAAQVDGASTVAFRNGVEIKQTSGTSLDFQSAEPGAFRVEIRVTGAPGTPPVPWVVSNPIFRFPPPEAGEQPPPARPIVHSFADAAWRVERSEGSEGGVRSEGGGVRFRYALRGGPPTSQFAALVADLPRDPPEFNGVTFSVQATRPTRISAQLRFASDDNARWRKSVYADEESRSYGVGLDTFRRADGPPQRPDVRRATSVLFVIDLTNARPGEAGEFTIRDVALTR
jgi:hypothetical protein